MIGQFMMVRSWPASVQPGGWGRETPCNFHAATKLHSKSNNYYYLLFMVNIFVYFQKQLKRLKNIQPYYDTDKWVTTFNLPRVVPNG